MHLGKKSDQEMGFRRVELQMDPLIAAKLTAILPKLQNTPDMAAWLHAKAQGTIAAFEWEHGEIIL